MKYFYLLLLVLLPCTTFAQHRSQKQIDSCLKALTDSKQDNNEVLLRIMIDSLYANGIDPDQGLVYGSQALDLAKYLGWKRGEGLSNMQIGMTYKAKAEYKRALPYLFTAQKIFEDENNNLDLAICLKNIGIVYSDQGQYADALDYYNKALEKAGQLNDGGITLAKIDGNLCNLYESQGQYDKALDYGMRSMKIFAKNNYPIWIATGYGNIAIVYKSMGNYDSALYYAQKALKLFRDLGDQPGIAINLGNLGEVYLSSAKDSNGNQYYPQERAMAAKADNLRMAIDNFNQAINLSNDINLVENMVYLYPLLSEAYAVNGDYKGAYESQLAFQSAKDSAMHHETKTQLETIVSNQDLQLKSQQAEIEQLKKQNQLTKLIASVAVLLIILAIVINRFVKQVKSNRILAKEKKIHLEKIEAQATVLSDIAYTQSHDVRGEVATILGLAQIFNFDDPADPTNKAILEGITEVTERLDNVVKSTIVKENEFSNEIRIKPNKNTLG